MISVETLFNRVKDLSRKDKAGYTSSVEFNRDLAEAQSILMDYYYSMFEVNQKTLDCLSPFIKEVRLPISNQFVDFPDDYRYKLELAYAFAVNTKTEDCAIIPNPEITLFPMQHLKTGEVHRTLSSAIRRPFVDFVKGKGKFAYTYVNNKIKVFPKEIQGFVELRYITDPTEALYNTVVNTTTGEEDFVATTALANPSIDLVWNEQEQPNLVDILLFFKGIQIRESDLVSWVIQKSRYAQNLQ